MNVDRLRTLPLAVRLTVPIATIGLALAACGSSSSSKTTPAAPAAPASSGAAAGGVTLDMHSGGPGTFLTDAAGRSVYQFGADAAMKSNCSGACATAWPPLTSTAAASAGSGVTASKIATITRADGTKQVTYNGHPLYYFIKDTAAGQTNGQGKTAFGAEWTLLTPAGGNLAAGGGGGATKPATGGGY
jgi:predicted lipoprotein with Yx(FWY)xxD motif